MKALLDTNIIIHREAPIAINEDIGTLFKYFDKLKVEKCVHPITIQEIEKNINPKSVETFKIKINNYSILKTVAPLDKGVAAVCSGEDETENDKNDTTLLNEIFCGRADMLITEDRKIHKKARLLGIAEKIYTIEAFIEKAIQESPEFADYKTLSIKKELFGNINIDDVFFDSLKSDYPGFKEWFNKKSDESAYICKAGNNIVAFLYLKFEDDGSERYDDINPRFYPKRRLKIGTFKVGLNGFKLGERFLKIIFDNAVRFRVEEIYLTIFSKTTGQEMLMRLIEDYGFHCHGIKRGIGDEEKVYVRDFSKKADASNPKLTFPFISGKSNIFLSAIYPEYHTDLFPDSILNTESPSDYVENEPFRNAIAKVFISRSIERNLKSGDLIIFYRTGGYYKGVITTIGIVENTITNIPSETKFIELCRKRSVFGKEELIKHWNYNHNYRPFIVNFLYAYSFPKRINLENLIKHGIVKDFNSAPRGFMPISKDQFQTIIKLTQTDESIIID